MEEREFITKAAEMLMSKKELRGAELSFVSDIVRNRCPKKVLDYSRNQEFKSVERLKEYGIFFKESRAFLRDIYGLYNLATHEKKKRLLMRMVEDPSLKNHCEMLKLHRSTKERLEYYPFLYEQIFMLTGKPAKILDIGCGLNPFSYPFLDCKPEYTACDISAQDIGLIQDYFDSLSIKGSSFCFDAASFKKSKLTKFISADVCFLLKMADVLEKQKRGVTLEIIRGIDCRRFVVSFPSKSISGKADIKERHWFERAIKNAGLDFESVKVPNETFYVVEKR